MLNWGIIGCGDVCEIKSGPAFNTIDGSKLLAVMRRDETKAKDFATRHNVPIYYTDAENLLNDKKINAVYIATPPVNHDAYAIQALQAGKFVYVEKPVALNAIACKRIIEAEKKYNGKVSVAHYRRGLSLFIKIKKLIKEGEIGKIKSIQLHLLQSKNVNLVATTKYNWRINPAISGGGYFHDLAPHQLDILYWIFGNPLNTSLKESNKSASYDAPDLVHLSANFKNEISFNGIWNFNVAENANEDLCEIIGEKGSIKFSFFRNPILSLTSNESTIVTEEPYPSTIQLPHIKNVCNFFNGIAPNPCSLQDALVTMEMMDLVGF